MSDRDIRDIKLEKGATFTTKFICDFERDWLQVTRAIRESGKDLSIPIVKG